MRPYKHVSPLVPRQLPSEYLENGSLLPDFLKAYYSWLEQGDVTRLRAAGGGPTLTVGSYALLERDPEQLFLVLGSNDSSTLVLGDPGSLLPGDVVREVVSGPTELTGQLSSSASSLYLSGNGTRFSAELTVGSYVLLDGALRKIVSIYDDVSATTDTPSSTTVVLKTAQAFSLGEQLIVGSSTREPNPIYGARSLPEWFDVDYTTNDLLSRFKEEYLGDFPEELATDKRFFIKHALDFYRVKGTPLAVKVLFRALYAEDAVVFEPWKHVFTPSAAKWVVPKYIEVAGSASLDALPGRVIRSQMNGGSAVVESFVRRLSSGQVINVLTLSNLSGGFHKGDAIFCDELSLYPVTRVLGSLSAVSVTDGGANFSVGDKLTVLGRGYSGTGVVTSTRESRGIVNFSLNYGGTGYTRDAVVSISGGGGVGATFKIGDIVNTETLTYVTDVIGDYQDKQLDNDTSGFVLSITGTSGTFSAGHYVTSSANVSTLDVNVLSGELTPGELVSNGAFTARVSRSDQEFLELVGASSTCAPGTVLLGNSSGASVSVNSFFGTRLVTANGYVTAANSSQLSVRDVKSVGATNWQLGNVVVTSGGVGYSNTDYVTFQGVGSGGSGAITTDANGSVQSVAIQDAGSSWTATPNVAFVTSTGSNASATGSVFLTSGAFLIRSVVTDSTSGATATTSSVQRETDWGFSDPYNPWNDVPDNLDTPMSDSFSLESKLVGSIGSLISVAHGSGYSSNPVVTVTQTDVASIGLSDGQGGVVGNNAIITANGSYGTGIVSSVRVVDSGFGYEPNETLSMLRADGALVSGRAVVDQHGKFDGYWRNNKGFCNSDQYIQDSYYWQRFSYEVQAPRVLESYEDDLRALAHPTGYALFGKFSKIESLETPPTLVEEAFTTEVVS